jgi:phage terminase Nu1 subunit (DNA packaging protein)
MSEQEFELYLKLLAKCLRLTSGQREQIADELRDHLEERLEELARAGVPRAKAVVQALDEFGDAAVLAAHFTTIARLKRRRFLMRLSLGSVGALTAGLLIAFAFWPDNRAVRGPERIVAQEKSKAEKPKAKSTKPDAPPSRSGSAGSKRHGTNNHAAQQQPQIVLEPAPVDHPLSSDVVERSKVETRIVEALAQPVEFNIEPQALKEALEFIANRYQIPILIDQKAIEDANIDLSSEVKLNVPGITLHDLFHWLFAQMNQPMGYEVRNGALMISTIDRINDDLTVVVYDCRDLVNLATLDRPVVAEQGRTGGVHQAMFQFAGPIGPAPTAAKSGREEKPHEHAAARLPLIQTVISTAAPEAWQEGTSISEVGGLLVIRQNPFEHVRIKRLLASIRLMRKDGAFAALSDQYDMEAKKRLADERAQTTRLSQLEHEVQLLRTQQAAPGKPSVPSTTTR